MREKQLTTVNDRATPMIVTSLPVGLPSSPPGSACSQVVSEPTGYGHHVMGGGQLALIGRRKRQIQANSRKSNMRC